MTTTEQTIKNLILSALDSGKELKVEDTTLLSLKSIRQNPDTSFTAVGDLYYEAVPQHFVRKEFRFNMTVKELTRMLEDAGVEL